MTTFSEQLRDQVGQLIIFTANDGLGSQTGTVISVDLDGRAVISVAGVNRTYQESNITFWRAP